MVFRMLVGNLLREATQSSLRGVVEQAAQGPRSPADVEGPVDVLVAMALAQEAGGLVDLLTDAVHLSGQGFTERLGRLGKRRLAIVETGVGAARAAAAVDEALARRRPQWVISAGFAGGLSDALHRGHFLLADRVAAQAGGAFEIGLAVDRAALAATPGVHVGTLLTVDRVMQSAEEKRRLGERHAALACDMETAAVAAVCAKAKSRLLSVRVISDAVDDTLPPEVEKLLAQDSTAGKVGAAASALWNRPA
ncbi:MAG: hypothetical protein KDA41_18420, partial [Planctomycetales bacterium]|nr:hypothetical protein [Planctomycetales bacterium]